MKCPNCFEEMPEGAIKCEACGAETNVEEQMPEEKKSFKLKKPVIAAIAVAAVLVLVVVGVLAAKIFGGGNSKEIVIDALSGVFNDKTERPMEEIFGLKEMAKTLQTDNTQVSLGLKVENCDPSIAGEYAEMLIGSGITVLAKNDLKNKKYFANVKAQYQNMDLLSSEVYQDDKLLMLKIPEVSERAFTLNYADDLAEQISNSPYMGAYIEESGIDVTIIEDYVKLLQKAQENGTSSVDIAGLWKRYKEGSKAISDLKAAMTVTSKDKATFTVDGKEESCKGYEVVITRDALAQFVEATSEYMLEDETFKAEFFEYMDTNLQSMFKLNAVTPMAGAMTAEESWAEMKKSIDEMVAEFKDSAGDVNLVVYVDRQGRLASLDAMLLNEEDGESSEVKLHVELKGGIYLTQNMDVALTATDSYDSTVTLSIQRKGTYDKKILTSDVVVEANDVKVTYTGMYDVENASYELGVSAEGAGVEMANFTAKGVVEDLVKGKAANLVVDSLTVNMSGQPVIELSGNYSLMPMEGEVTVLEGEQMDILAATEEDWQEVIMEGYAKIIEIALKLQ